MGQESNVAYYIFAEDLANAIVGPFSTKAEALTHAAWCANIRCDAGTQEVFDSEEAALARAGGKPDLRFTPDQDKYCDLDQDKPGAESMGENHRGPF